MTDSKTILSASNLTVGYGAKEVLKTLDLKLEKGKLTCLLGPNGSGKSTLIRTLSKIQKPLLGKIELEQRPIDQFDNKVLSTKLSMVLTDRTSPGNLTAYALVSLGRFPYTSWMGTLSKADKHQIQWAMEVTDCIQFSDVHIGELSDGERQKVMIARALAQDTPMIFLDEPTAHLDLPNRIEIFHLLRELALVSKKAILLSSHDLDMALTNSDWLWLITPEKTIHSGLPEDLVLQGVLEKSFQKKHITFDYRDGLFKRKAKTSTRTYSITGDEVLLKWTRRALDRAGLEEEAGSNLQIQIIGDLNHSEWKIKDSKITFKTIEQLLKQLKT